MIKALSTGAWASIMVETSRGKVWSAGMGEFTKREIVKSTETLEFSKTTGHRCPLSHKPRKKEVKREERRRRIRLVKG